MLLFNLESFNYVHNPQVITEWEDILRRHQEKAIRTRCRLPSHLICPALGCDAEFRGEEAWDQRIEHVARHLDRATFGQEPDVDFGGSNDGLFLQWACSPEVDIIERQGGNWALTRRFGYISGPAQKRPYTSVKKEDGVTIVVGEAWDAYEAEEHSDYSPSAPGALIREDNALDQFRDAADSAYGSMATTVARKFDAELAKDSSSVDNHKSVDGNTFDAYSTASTLDRVTTSTYVSEFVDELKSALPLRHDKDGWERILPALGEILQEFSIRIAYEETLADRPTCRRIMYLVQKYHR